MTMLWLLVAIFLSGILGFVGLYGYLVYRLWPSPDQKRDHMETQQRW